MEHDTTDASPVRTSQVINRYYPYPATSPSSYRYSSAQQNELVLSTYSSSDTRYLCKPIIFNHKTYSKATYVYGCPNVREGTDQDVQRLLETFKIMGNCDNPDVYTDKTVLEIEDILKKAVQSDQSAYSCLMVIVLTHGEEHLLYAYDKTYPITTLWKALTKGKPQNGTLVGKPKLFFIQACRGGDLDVGALTEVDFPEMHTKRIPLCADILIAYSAFLGYKSVRNTLLGSWFIQTLCDCLETYKDNHDVMTMLTIVQHSIANTKVFQGDKKQMPTVETTLTKKLYLTRRKVIMEQNISHYMTEAATMPQKVLRSDDPDDDCAECPQTPDSRANVKWLSFGLVAGILVSWMAKKLIKC